MSEKQAIKVGDPSWFFDVNRRVYRKDANGRSMAGPIWAEHWREYAITGETSRSWIVGNAEYEQAKLPKNQVRWSGYVLNREAIEFSVWVHNHAHRICEKVRGTSDYATLRQIAALIGYEQSEPT